MSIIGIIQIEGEEQYGEFLEVGVFCNSECRSTARPAFTASFDRCFVFLTIFGAEGDAISFRFYPCHGFGIGQDLCYIPNL